MAEVEGARRRAQDELVAMIEEHGVAIRHVFDGPGGERVDFAYTVGLTAVGHPEIVVEGLPKQSAHVFLNEVATAVHAGDSFRAGTIRTDLTVEPAPIVFLRADDTSGLDAIEDVYGRSIEEQGGLQAVQLVWTDSAGYLPWQSGYNNPPDQQRLRGPVPAGALALPAPADAPSRPDAQQLWSITDPDVVAVSPAVLGGTAVTSVWHTQDGTWCFTTDGPEVVALQPPLVGVGKEHLLTLDSSLQDVLALPAEVRAFRSGGHGAAWVQGPHGSA